MIHLAHLSQVDCQFGSHPKPFQNNDLQFDAGRFQVHLAYFEHVHTRRRFWKNVLEEEISTAGIRPFAYGKAKIAGTKDGKVTAYEVDCYGSPGVGAHKGILRLPTTNA